MLSKNTIICLAFFILFCCLWGCAGNSQVTHMQLDTPATLPAKPAIEPEYQLGYGDVVEVKFFRSPQFNETVTVRPDGRISLQRIGDVYVAGMTPARLDRLITQSYNEILVDPDVTVFVRNIGSHKVYVLGEVQQPGGYPVERDMTVLQTLASAGGPKESAKLKNIIILRQSPDKSLLPIMVNLTSSLKHGGANGDAAQNITIQARDIIYVPKTAIASVSSFMNQIYNGILPPVDLYLRAVLFYNR